MSDSFKQARKKGCQAMVVTCMIGLAAGFLSRLALAGDRTQAQILQSTLGLIAFTCVGMGIYAVVTAKQQIRPFRLVLGILLLAGGIMWIVPFPQ